MVFPRRICIPVRILILFAQLFTFLPQICTNDHILNLRANLLVMFLPQARTLELPLIPRVKTIEPGLPKVLLLTTMNSKKNTLRMAIPIVTKKQILNPKLKRQRRKPRTSRERPD